jgi:site-specific DNA recombinase
VSNRKNVTPVVPTQPKVIRCALYTRKSTEEGLEQAFNSLDAQRESAEAYVAAQRHEGWTCLPDRYDDGGYSGGTIERPALKRLLADIEAGKIDCVVVYKVDRLSRSLMDFSRVMQTFEQHGVSFVSVTQQFNTTHSMGRLTLNILLSFAQFEREIISERTRDKIAAARRKGKWSGGQAILGYDVLSSPSGSKLVVNEEEAHRVRTAFELYLEHEALIPTVTALNKRGWTNKRSTTKAGKERGGRPFDKTTLYKLLTSVAYTGVVTHKGTSYPGEHQAIVSPATFEKVKAVLGRNGRTAGAPVKNKYGALLKGLVSCGCCKCAMVHSYSARAGKDAKRYRYYVCLKAQKQGWASCTTKSVPAGELERFVVDQVRRVGKEPAVLTATLRQMRERQEKAKADLAAEQKAVGRELARHHNALMKLLGMPAPDADRLAELNEQIRITEQKATDLHEKEVVLHRENIDPALVTDALAAFDPVWEQLSPKEQARVVRLLVERVVYDGAAGSVAVTFRPSGLKALAQEQGRAA